MLSVDHTIINTMSEDRFSKLSINTYFAEFGSFSLDTQIYTNKPSFVSGMKIKIIVLLVLVINKSVHY